MLQNVNMLNEMGDSQFDDLMGAIADEGDEFSDDEFDADMMKVGRCWCTRVCVPVYLYK